MAPWRVVLGGFNFVLVLVPAKFPTFMKKLFMYSAVLSNGMSAAPFLEPVVYLGSLQFIWKN